MNLINWIKTITKQVKKQRLIQGEGIKLEINSKGTSVSLSDEILKKLGET